MSKPHAKQWNMPILVERNGLQGTLMLGHVGEVRSSTMAAVTGVVIGANGICANGWCSPGSNGKKGERIFQQLHGDG